MPRATPLVVLEEGQNYTTYLTEQQEYKRQLVSKWKWLLSGEEHGLEPIEEKFWESMAIMFENQQATSQGFFTEATMTTDVTLPQKYALPIIRKVYPQLLASKIASIQPMPLMSGGVAKVFYQDFKREDVSPETSLTTLDSDYALGSENSVPLRVKMEISSITIEAIKDILGASWSTEVQEDARGALGLNVEKELVTNMAQEILREIDQRILAEIIAGATAGATTWNWTMGAGYTTAKDWYQTLGDALIDLEDLIYSKRYRAADYLVCGRRLARYIRKMSDFVPAPTNQPPDAFPLGVKLLGTLTGFWDVYVTVFINQDTGVMGVYPRSQTDTGYIYAPYIPLAPMPLVYAEYEATTGYYKNVDKWSRNVRTRYGKKMVVGDLFGTITISA